MSAPKMTSVKVADASVVRLRQAVVNRYGTAYGHMAAELEEALWDRANKLIAMGTVALEEKEEESAVDAFFKKAPDAVRVD